MDSRYLYEVRPLRPITISGGKSLRRPSSMQLTKEEVKTFLKYGPVYRKFTGEDVPPIKVTGDNLDQLHQPVYHGVTETKVEEPIIPEVVNKPEEHVIKNLIEAESSGPKNTQIPDTQIVDPSKDETVDSVQSPIADAEASVVEEDKEDTQEQLQEVVDDTDKSDDEEEEE